MNFKEWVLDKLKKEKSGGLAPDFSNRRNNFAIKLPYRLQNGNVHLLFPYVRMPGEYP